MQGPLFEALRQELVADEIPKLGALWDLAVDWGEWRLDLRRHPEREQPAAHGSFQRGLWEEWKMPVAS